MLYRDDIKAQERRKRTYYKHRESNIKKTAEWRVAHPEQRNATERKRNAERRRTDPEYREKNRQRSIQSYQEHREARLLLAKKHNGTEKAKARETLHNAIKRREIIKPSRCDICHSNSHFIQAHHDDYSKPLIVLWLCVFCHGEKHQKDHKQLY